MITCENSLQKVNASSNFLLEAATGTNCTMEFQFKLLQSLLPQFEKKIPKEKNFHSHSPMQFIF